MSCYKSECAALIFNDLCNWEMNNYLDICISFSPNIKRIRSDPKKKTKTKKNCFCFADVHISASQHEIFYHCAMLKKKNEAIWEKKRKEKKKELQELFCVTFWTKKSLLFSVCS